MGEGRVVRERCGQAAGALGQARSALRVARPGSRCSHTATRTDPGFLPHDMFVMVSEGVW